MKKVNLLSVRRRKKRRKFEKMNHKVQVSLNCHLENCDNYAHVDTLRNTSFYIMSFTYQLPLNYFSPQIKVINTATIFTLLISRYCVIFQ